MTQFQIKERKFYLEKIKMFDASNILLINEFKKVFDIRIVNAKGVKIKIKKADFERDVVPFGKLHGAKIDDFNIAFCYFNFNDVSSIKIGKTNLNKVIIKLKCGNFAKIRGLKEEEVVKLMIAWDEFNKKYK